MQVSSGCKALAGYCTHRTLTPRTQERMEEDEKGRGGKDALTVVGSTYCTHWTGQS